MTNKYQLINEIANDTLKEITRSSENWIKFLNTASNNYKYSFSEQVLIYAQKPEATACAEIEIWNKRLKRWVNKGAKGIALISIENGRNTIRHVFDISDTHSGINKELRLWEVKPSYANGLIETLENSFGNLEMKKNLSEAIYSCSSNLVEDNYNDYLKELKEVIDNSSLQELEDVEIDGIFISLLINSVTYMVMKRCGLNPTEILNSEVFNQISSFNTKQVISRLGAAITDIAEQELREIYSSVRNFEKSRNNINYTFVNNQKTNYHVVESKNEGRNDYARVNIQTNGRLSSTTSSITTNQETATREILKNEGEIPKGTQKRIIRGINARWQDGRTFRRNRGNSSKQIKINNQTISREVQSERRNERKKSDGMGRTDEFNQSSSRGNSNAGVNLQLDLFSNSYVPPIKELPNVEEQINNIQTQAEVENTSAFSFTQKDIEQAQKVNNLFKAREENGKPLDRDEYYKNLGKINYHIDNNSLGEGTPKEKVRRNIEAIKLLKKLEDENRLATKEEQEVLAGYVGWGGLPDVFDENKANWSEEYHELKELLTNDEYKSARASTLTAFYTPPIVINAIYKTLQNMGLEQANILEPSCGTGNFLGMLPEEIQNSKLYGIELDSISGRIAKQLYQKADIRIEGYEKVDLPDSFFDVAIGNVPFGDFKVNDSRYNKNNFLIHDYFFAKTLDKVRPNGVIAFITSKGTMDKANPEVRKYIAQRAELLGAIRLPDNTFTKNAGTKVTSDIIFLQKRENLTDIMPDWVYLDKDENNISMNKYFIDNPDMILGKMEIESTQYGFDSNCKAIDGENLEDRLNNAITNIHGELENNILENDIEQEDTSIPAVPSVKNFSYAIIDEKIYFRENSRMILQDDLPLTNQNRIKGLITLREQTRKLIDFQLEDCLDEELQIAQAKLNETYDKFTKEYGIINSRANENAFSNDSSYFLLCSLEKLDGEGNFIGKADMFTKRTIKARKEVKQVDTSNEALILSIQEKAKVDLEYMSELTGKDVETIIKELKCVIFKVPIEEIYVTADEYLSGNVRVKLKIAESLLTEHPEYQINVEKLKEVVPKDLTASEIGIKLGATWIPAEIIRQFIFELLDTPRYSKWDIKVK